MSDKTKVYVKDSDLLSAKSLLELLSTSVDGMRHNLKTDTKLEEKNKYALRGAIEALTDLHNLILQQIKDNADKEAFESDDDHGGRFDA